MKLELVEKEATAATVDFNSELTSPSSSSSSSYDEAQALIENDLKHSQSSLNPQTLTENISNHVNENTRHSINHHNHNHHNHNKNNHTHLNGDSTHHHHYHNHLNNNNNNNNHNENENENENESKYDELDSISTTTTTTSSNSLIITSLIKSSTIVSNTTADNLELEHLDEHASSTTTTNALGNSPISEPINKRPRLSNT